jgi:fructosamine-3-kinase
VRTFVKPSASVPLDFFACEAAGLHWLSAAQGAHCVEVVAHDEVSLTLAYLDSTRPTPESAERFGRGLARTHGAGARGFGAPPDGWTGQGFFGPLQSPLPMSLRAHASWGEFYAEERLAPFAQLAATQLDATSRADVDDVLSRCRSGDFDDDEQPARLHGDLWSGNLMWTARGVVLIDPAAHGGHRETDIAMLHLFGCPYLDEILQGYQGVQPLRPGWRDRIGLHQLFPLLAHAALFGSGYRDQVAAAARSALKVS